MKRVILPLLIFLTSCTPEQLALLNRGRLSTSLDAPGAPGAKAGSLSLAEGAVDAGLAAEPLIRQGQGQEVILRGRIDLPAVHPRNLFPAMQRAGGHEVGHGVMNVSEAQRHQLPHHHQPGYQVRNASQLRLDRLFRLRAQPLPGTQGLSIQQLPPRPPLTQRPGQTPLRPPLASASADPSAAEDAQIYGGTVDQQGRFELRLPPSPGGYMLSAASGKVRFKYRLARPLAAGTQIDELLLSPGTTLVANAARQLGPAAQALSNAEIQRRLPGLATELVRLREGLRGYLRGQGFERSARRLLGQGFSTRSHSSTSPSGAAIGDFFNGCSRATDASHVAPATCYLAGDEEIYNLTSESEILSSKTAISFGTTASSTTQLNSYASSNAVFSIYSQAAPYPTRNAASGTIETSAGRLTSSGGRLTVMPALTAMVPNQWTGVDIRFVGSPRTSPAPVVQSVGLNIKAVSGRRQPFRLTVLDPDGAEIHAYHWHTTSSSESDGFYGLSVPASVGSIGTVRVEFRIPNANHASYDPRFWIDNLSFSTDYMGGQTLDSSGSSLQDNLGWRASGWTRQSSASSSFSHPYSQGYVEYEDGTAKTASGGTTANFRAQYSSSGGTYWQAGYGTSADGSTLTGPAFTLSNMDLDSDDVTASSVGYTSMLPGVDMSSATSTLAVSGAPPGYPSTFSSYQVPFCRIGIPSSCPASFRTAAGAIWTYDIAPMGTHWGHIHWQAYTAVEDAAEVANVSGSTERYVEYSTDNGSTWRKAYWFEDENHHGKNGYWWKNHMHPYPDSDLASQTWGYDFNGDGTTGSTDFDKDGVMDYSSTFDNNLDGVVDSGDSREWDTEWYMEWIDPSLWTDVDSDSHLESSIEGSTLLYRFRFVAPGSAPASCSYDPSGGAAGETAIASCDGWRVDDVAFNNDTPRVGYYTSFDGSYDYSVD
ncbi:MAG: hypothetical protein CVV27_03710 [Candidatus Melainabacteria bacterium HGW-Melainabacteria-1]|nr:MAG: hypothetical protein CVV27_03710 [Candidatus Melainabacteria bacterium HGW-Melainabacteria-1]